MNDRLDKILKKSNTSSPLEDMIGWFWLDWNGKSEIEENRCEQAAAELAALEAIAEAARTGQGLDDALDALDALKGEK
jgi:hypothetical protein